MGAFCCLVMRYKMSGLVMRILPSCMRDEAGCSTDGGIEGGYGEGYGGVPDLPCIGDIGVLPRNLPTYCPLLDCALARERNRDGGRCVINQH